MSVVNLEKPIQKQGTSVVDRPQVKTRAKSRPQVRIRVDVQERRAPQRNAAAEWLARAFMCGAAFVLTYAGSSLGGQVMVENARRQEISARERARDARKAEASLRARVDSLTNPAAVEAWAATHGFAAPKPEIEVPTERSGYVARR
jgi:hypothetical protein